MPLIKNILLADDDQDDVELFEHAVSEFCDTINLIVAANGVELLRLLSVKPKPDVIFLDLNMPRKTGKECLVEIRNNPEYNQVPIIILSTSSQQSEIDFCLEKGANHYIIKPSSFTGIISIVKRICSGSLYNDQFILQVSKIATPLS